MSDATGLSRGDRNRNAKLTALRALVPLSNAIAAIDLADDKQMLVVTDHNSRVLARRTFRRRAWQLGAALDWAAAQAGRAGFAAPGPARFEAAVRRELPRWDCQKPRLSIVRGVFAALSDPTGVTAHRRGALERSNC